MSILAPVCPLLAGCDFTFNNRNHLDAIDFLPNGVNSPYDYDYSNEDVDYSYDNRGQLAGADQSGTTDDETYTYDANGNRLNANGNTYTTGDDNRLTSDGTFNYLYDNEGNRTRRTEIATGNYTTYDWDHRNRLVAARDYDASDNLTQEVNHVYDAYSQWIKRAVDQLGSDRQGR